MKHMNKLRVAFCAAAVVVAVAFFACSKEKEPAAQQPTEVEAARKPIATFDNATGQMTYHVSVEQLQEAMDRQTNEDRFVIESWEIMDDANGDIPLTLKLVMLDTENEVSITTYLVERFVEKLSYDNVVNYFISDDFASGNYSYYEYSDDRKLHLITVKHNKVFSIEEVENSNRVQNSGYTVTCTGKDCKEKGCAMYRDDDGYLGCTPCGTSNGHCTRTESYTSSLGPLFPNR